MLSAIVLNYPPPTLINFNKPFRLAHWDQISRSGKIRGIYDYLSKNDKVYEDDLVLVVNGQHVWFQLPPEVLIKRFHRILKGANKQLKMGYGRVQLPGATEMGLIQKVMYAADKICWPQQPTGPACASIPISSLPKDAWGNDTDRDPSGQSNRPRFLNSGAVIGLAKDVKAVFESAVSKIEEQQHGINDDQAVISEIFGEQELHRDLLRKTYHDIADRWRQWITAKVTGVNNTHDPALSYNASSAPTRRYEYGLGLDYKMELFQSIARSEADVDFLRLDDVANLPATFAEHGIPSRANFDLASDLPSHPGPFAWHHQTTHVHDVNLTGFEHIPLNTSWRAVSLAANLRVPSVPALLLFNNDGEDSSLGQWWPRMWFYPHARSLLLRHVRLPLTNVQWDQRGGVGGVWTDTGHWFSWRQMCHGYEEEVFGDGLGEWGKENGDGKVADLWGQLIEDGERGW